MAGHEVLSQSELRGEKKTYNMSVNSDLSSHQDCMVPYSSQPIVYGWTLPCYMLDVSIYHVRGVRSIYRFNSFCFDGKSC